jgi:sugar (pentulose or hexulose) kinase
MSRPRHGVAFHPDDDLWVAIADASRQAMKAFAGDVREIVGVGLCPIRCCKAFLKADGSLAEPVISWMDDALPAYCPTTRSWHATTRRLPGPPVHGQFSDTGVTTSNRAMPIDTDTWQWSDDPRCYEQFGVRPDMRSSRRCRAT